MTHIPILRPSIRRRRRSRGAASVEAVIVIPFFILVFVSLLYVRDQAVGKQTAEMHARTCAWLYSANDCSEIPADCQDVLTPHSGVSASEAESALGDGARRLTSQGGVVESVVRPLIMPALQAAFGRSVDATVSREVERPGAYGGGMKIVTGRYHLACNLEHTTPIEVVEDAWRRIRPW